LEHRRFEAATEIDTYDRTHGNPTPWYSYSTTIISHVHCPCHGLFRGELVLRNRKLREEIQKGQELGCQQTAGQQHLSRASTKVVDIVKSCVKKFFDFDNGAAS